jgi:DNA repair protein RadA/Sms
LISHKDEESGTAIASTLEGMRPLMIEIQLLQQLSVRTPQRSTTGYNAKRLNMILAVLEKGLVLGWPKMFF